MDLSVPLWYVFSCMFVSIVFIYEIWIPVMKELEKIRPNDNMIKNKFLSYSVFFLSGMAIAPILLPICIIPKASEIFRKQLLETLNK